MPPVRKTPEQIAADRAKYQAEDVEKRNALRNARAGWREAAEELATTINQLLDGDLGPTGARGKVDAIMKRARAQHDRRGKNGS